MSILLFNVYVIKPEKHEEFHRNIEEFFKHLEENPEARAVVNFAPILLEQLDDYHQCIQKYLSNSGSLHDPMLAALAEPTLSCSDEEHLTLIKHCLRANRDTMIDRFPAFKQLATIADWLMAIFTIPAPLVSQAMTQCVRKRVKTAVLISAGFAETGPKGKALQDEVVKIARQGGIRFMGPNGMGIWSSPVRLNTAFWFTPKPGGISFVSQSGTMGAYLLETATNKGYGFNAFLSVGNQADLSMTDYLAYLGNDDGTSVIVLYIEGLKDGCSEAEVEKIPIMVVVGDQEQQNGTVTPRWRRDPKRSAEAVPVDAFVSGLVSEIAGRRS